LLAGALQHQVCELQRLLGKKTLESVILHEVLYLAQPKTAVALAFAREGRHAKKTVSDTLAVACSKPGSTSSRRTTPAARSPATTECGIARRDQKDHRRSADLRLSAGSRADPMTTRPTGRGGGQC
jgi:hypothetical protein